MQIMHDNNDTRYNSELIIYMVIIMIHHVQYYY